MPEDKFSNPNLTPNDIRTIRLSSDPTDILTQRYGLMPIEVDVIRGAIDNAATAIQPASNPLDPNTPDQSTSPNLNISSPYGPAKTD